jgi:outer membrane protein
MKQVVFFIVIAFFGSASLFAQELLTPNDAIRIALEHNYGVRIAKSTAEMADNNLSIGNAGFLPRLNLDGNYNGGVTTTRQEYNDGRVLDREGAASSALTGRIGLDWTLFDGFRMFVEYDRLQQLKEIGDLNARLAMEETVAGVIASYFDIVTQEYLLRVYQNALTLSQERIRLAQARSSVGTGAAPDLLKAQVDLNTDSSNVLRQQLAITNAKIRLNQLLGRPNTTPVRVQEFQVNNTNNNIQLEFDNAPDVPPDFNLAQLREIMLQRNSNLQAAAANRALADLELQSARSFYYPTIIANLDYNYTASNSQAGLITYNRSYGPSYGLTATMNIFDGLNTQRQIENARILATTRELEYNDIQTQLEADIRIAYDTYTNSRTLLNLEVENLRAARRNVDIATERLRVGTITSYELREIQRDLLESENRIINARYQSKLAETQLQLISGSLLR